MTELTKNPVLSDSAALLLGYGFDLGVFEVDVLVSYWSTYYPPHWLRAAILEALHQGRYKAISVGQILVIWRRRGQPLPHYSYEFERAVSTRFPASRGSSSAMASPASTALTETPDSSHHSQAAVASPDSVECPPFQQSIEIESPEVEIESTDSSGEPQDRSQATPAADPEAVRTPRQQATAPSSMATAVELSTAASSTEDEALELWGRASIMHLPIHQYVPIVPRFETSTFYAKLRAVASNEML